MPGSGPSSDERAGWVLFGVPDQTAVLAHYKRRATYYVFGARSWESFSASVSCLQIKIKIKIKINCKFFFGSMLQRGAHASRGRAPSISARRMSAQNHPLKDK